MAVMAEAVRSIKGWLVVGLLDGLIKANQNGRMIFLLMLRKTNSKATGGHRHHLEHLLHLAMSSQSIWVIKRLNAKPAFFNSTKYNRWVEAVPFAFLLLGFESSANPRHKKNRI